MGRVVIFPILAIAFLGCPKKHHDSGPPPPADYSAPIWHIKVVDQSGGLPVATAKQLEARYTLVTQQWLDFWKTRSGGKYRPAVIPTGHQYATVVYVRTCSNSAEEEGDGPYGAVIHVWSCTQQRGRGVVYGLQAACHRLSHAISGLSGGNAAHPTFREVCGC